MNEKKIQLGLDKIQEAMVLLKDSGDTDPTAMDHLEMAEENLINLLTLL